MAVPSNVVDRINRLEIARKRVDERKRADRTDQARRLAVIADRNARRPTLMALVEDIFAWRENVMKSRDGQRLWNLIGPGTRVFLFSDWFWEGLPIVANNKVRAHTRVFLDGPSHHFLIEEWRNDSDGILAPYQELCRLKSQLEMVDHPMVHPLLIEGLQTHLSGPEAWESVLDELDRRLARYVTAP